MAEWHCHIGGKQYGPVEEEQLAGWIREGRVQATDLVWQEGMAQWQPASSVAALSSLFVVDPPNAPAAGSDAPPPPLGDRQPAGPHCDPHRGGAVLTLGIIGIVLSGCCPIFGICAIIAWVMGSGDLKKMDAGQRDPAGRDITKAGMICGIIGAVLMTLRLLSLLVLAGGTGLDLFR